MLEQDQPDKNEKNRSPEANQRLILSTKREYRTDINYKRRTTYRSTKTKFKKETNYRSDRLIIALSTYLQQD